MLKHIMRSTIKYLAYSLLPLLLLASCEDGDMGVKIRPTDDFLTVHVDSFPLQTKTIYAGSLYSETDKVVLGEYSDNVFGSFKVDFLSEFRYIRDLTFTASTVGDSLDLVLYYKGFFGDSSAVQEVTVYRLDRQALDFSTNYKSDIDVDEFCSRSEVLGVQRYVAYDQTVDDSIRALSSYCNTVRIRMPESMMNDLITKTDIYKSQSAFVEYLKGVYVTNTFGSQTVLEIDSVNLEMGYHYTDTLTSVLTGLKDSMVTRTASVLFPANRETTEVIHVESNPVDLSTIPDSVEYISTPGGTFVEVNIPYEEIYQRVVKPYEIANDSLLNINYYSLLMEPAVMADSSVRTTTPIYFILVRKADMDKFFTQSLYPVDGISTVIGVWNYYSTDDGRYTFANAGDDLETTMYIARGLGSDEKRKEYFDSLNPYVIVPVSGATDIAGTGATIRHLFDTYGIRVRSGSNTKSPMRFVITYTNL